MQSIGYLSGILAGLMGMTALLVIQPEALLLSVRWLSDWTMANLASSVWLFSMTVAAFLLTLYQLKACLDAGRQDYRQVVRLDQISDVLIHVFVGIGVIWTAIGMRSALTTTLSVPAALGDDAGLVLARLVEGGILVALSTTIVGAVGGYLMRLLKTLWLSAPLTDYYRQSEQGNMESAVASLARIESLLDGDSPANRLSGA